jgi:Transposase DDE domain
MKVNKVASVAEVSEIHSTVREPRGDRGAQNILDSIAKADEEQQTSIDPSAVQAAMEKLKQHPEPEVGFMLMRQNTLPAYNVQTAVDTEHALIVANTVVLDAADNRCLQPMAEAAKKALGVDSFNIVADAGYSNGEQAAHCEAAGLLPHVPVMRTVNNQGDGSLFGRKEFLYEPIPIPTSVLETRSCVARKYTVRTDIRFMKLQLATAVPAL